MSPTLAAGFAPFFRKLPSLRPGEKAAAVHFGNFPGEGRPMRIDDLFNQAEVAARVALENTPRSAIDAGSVDANQSEFGRAPARTPDAEGQVSAMLTPRAGETRIAAFSHVWRNRERGPLHAPEFTMLEWYRAGEDYAVLMEDCAAMLRLAAQAAGAGVLRFRGAECDPFAAPERLSVAEAFRRHAGVDLLATIGPDGAADRNGLAAQAAARGLRVAADDTWSDILSRILTARVEPHLGHGRATILDRYPAPEAALARRAADDPREAERFELYACGVELANGFGELTDPAEQRRRLEAEMDERQRVHGERYPLDEDFLAALARMPPASGIALGFDRLVMLATGAPRIDDVQWTPVP